jgi:site-specific recombinase XerC
MTSKPERSPGKNDKVLERRLIKAWIERQRSHNTQAAYGTDLKTFGAWCASRGSIVLHADLDTMVAFVAAREAAGDSPSTLRRRWSALSSFFDFAIDQNAARTNPLLGVPRPSAISGNPSTTAQLSAGEVAAYRVVAASIDPRLDAIVALLVADGLKLGEALALDIDDISGRPPKTTLAIRRRGGTTRVAVDAGSANAILRCIGTRRDGPVFLSGVPSQGGPRRLTRFGADHLIRQLSGDGPHRVTANELRRFHITNGLHGDGDLATTRDRAGLASVRSVRRYLVEPGATSQATTMS